MGGVPRLQSRRCTYIFVSPLLGRFIQRIGCPSGSSSTMPSKLALFKKAPSKKVALKKVAPAPEPTPAPAPPPDEPAATEAARVPAEAAPVPAEAAPAPAEAAPVLTEAAPAEVAPAPEAAAPAEGEAAPAPPAEAAAAAAAAPAIEEPAAPAQPEAPTDAAAPAAPKESAAVDTAPAEDKPAEAVAAPTPEEAAPPAAKPADAAIAVPAADDAAAPAASEAPAEVAETPAAEAPPAEEPKPPTPPPPAVPTSEPLKLTLEDVNDSSVTIKWRPPETIGNSGLDGYTVEYCKDQTPDWVVVNEKLTEANRMVISDLTKGDLLHIRVVAVNVAGHSPPAVLAEPVKVTEIVARPKVRLPRSLRSRIVKQVGDQVNLVIPFNGKPKPLVTWTKDGEPLDTKTINVRNSEKDSILFIRTVDRSHSGTYQLSVKVESFEDKASIVIQIVDLPGPPASMKLVDNWGFSAALEWAPPKDTGNTEITGYTIQKSDKKTGEWFTVLEHYHRLSGTISDLVMGNSYGFRVFAENKCGTGKEATVAKGQVTIDKIGIEYTPPEYPAFDFSEAPKFTAPLNDHAATVGYTTRLLCAVRGTPKPKIEWLKNQMIIGDDPKFRQISNQGVCSLEIRKPCSFDGGIYTCRARNPHGEAAVACKLEVRQVILPEAVKGRK
ncbi:myosin-binding protein H-like isoform X33 [Conger conger]|uniref:myosin-binding protein H-like isoform X33 n=1 Tax=Conger conger TaxID=82655 RepID=UPI002A5A7490|nr:myosin-binding protein H-like isoform X33 [Conger conger]